MTTKDYLGRYLEADREIDARLEEVSRLRAMATKTTRAFSHTAGTGGNREDRLGEIVARIVDMEREVDAAIDELQLVRAQVEASIGAVEDGTLRVLLRYRYICGWTWEAISEKLGYTYRNVCYLHDKALRTIKLA